MSRRKQARPQHYASSDEELDDGPELDTSSGRVICKANTAPLLHAVSTSTGDTDSIEPKLAHYLDSFTSKPEKRSQNNPEEAEDNDENLNSGNLAVESKKLAPDERQDEVVRLKPLTNGISTESRNNHKRSKLENGHIEGMKENGLVDSSADSKTRDSTSNYTSPLKSNFNVNLSIAATMKNNSASIPGLNSHSSSTKNLCDKCGGSYATLAALISHKKSCKGALNRKRLAIEHRRIQNELLKKQQIIDSDSDNADDDNEPEDEPEKHITNSHSTEHNFKMMNDAVAAMEGSMGAFASNPGAQWPPDFFPPVPFAAPNAEIGTFLESLTPLFAQANATERSDNPSPTPEEQQHQQAALFTQQYHMLQLFHMLQQLHGSQIPLPFLAAMTAAATAHQQQPPQGSSSAIENSHHNGNDVTNDKSETSEEQNKSRATRPSTSSLGSLGDSTKADIRSEKDDEVKQSAKSSPANSPQAATSTRTLLTSFLDLSKDINPDAPLPPMMSPPKNESEAAPVNEPNTLELLQKHTEQALQNTMSGGSFLLNGSSENGDLLNFRKGKDGKEDPTSRHRCRYCGKVFGSDSALQIHIRSHTGERPFKCNVCGNRFTTKGNLKVHFQRHKAKYPHVKMNPHPVPEHLDKFHPPLEPPSNSQSPPPAPPGFFPPSTSTFSNNFHIPAIFTSTLMPFGAGDTVKSENDKSADEKLKTKSRTFFDFSDLYINKAEPIGNRENRSVNSDSSDSDEENEHKLTQGRGEDSDESDTDLENDGVINLRKKNRELDEEMDKDGQEEEPSNLSEKTTKELFEERMEEDNSNSRIDIDSNEEITDDDISQYGSSPGALPSSLSLMGFPFGVDLSSIPGSTSLGNRPISGHQSFAPSESDSDLGGEASRDPIFYQNLLPKPGSTDSTWETLMEVQKASETVKLQQLVDNIEHKLKDPNQCFFCKRVLSCKSALQMHYRTHTGERPFKCKICGRAFTTKGNLKTHMGVHRVKPPLRMMHQCPICHRQFTNALVLQQHIRTHAGESEDVVPDLLAELKNSPLMPSNFPRSLLPPNFGAPFPFPPMGAGFFPPSLIPEMAAQQLAKSASFTRPLASSLPNVFAEVEKEKKRAFEEEASDLSTNKDTKSKSYAKTEPEDEAPQSPIKSDGELSDFNQSLELNAAPTPTLTIPPSAQIEKAEERTPLNNGKLKPEAEVEVSTLSALENHVKKSISQVSPQSKSLFASHSADKSNALDLTPKSASDSSVRSPSVDSNSFPTSPYAGLQFHGAGRPNTTCRICCKTFACYSALEIHIRSHTKERPFKCEVCDRGFSTKGNMKQHMLTHKIRDLPPDLYTTVSPQANTTLGNFLTSNNISKILRKQSGRTSSNNSDSSSVASPQTPNGNNSNSVDSMEIKIRNTESPPGGHDQSSSSSRTSGSNKHMCRICNKPFSSGSALQIHMRTHTGDKPFKCSICGRAFTTKGNLKVHMGTHMWSSGNVSRRGRRMSIDLPSLQISPPAIPQPPPNQSQHEPGRPELPFFPYLPSHLANLGPEASQLAMQQMMLMKMMSTQNQSVHKLPSPALTPDKLRLSTNGDADAMDNVNVNDEEGDVQFKEELPEAEPDLLPYGNTKEENEKSDSLKGKTAVHEEGRSSRSEQSNNELDWPSKGWKMSCNYPSISPTELEQHIKLKAHLQAAVADAESHEDQSEENVR